MIYMKKELGVLILVIFSANLQTVYPQIVRSSLNGRRVCPGDEVTFTCETRGSLILAWTSEEYIGPGNQQLVFTAADNTGQIRESTVNPDVVAILISVDSGMEVLVSQLHIIASSDVSLPSTVQCVHGNGSTNEITFQYLDIPGPPRNPVAVENENMEDVEQCVILLEWSPPLNTDEADIDHYNITVTSSSGNTSMTIKGAVSFRLPVVPRCTADIKITLCAVNRCGYLGSCTEEITPELLEAGDMTTVSPSPSDDGNQLQPSTSFVLVPIVLSLVCFVILLVLFVIILFALRRIYQTVSCLRFNMAPPQLQSVVAQTTDQREESSRSQNGVPSVVSQVST